MAPPSLVWPKSISKRLDGTPSLTATALHLKKGKRTLVNASARDAGMSVVTADISCSEYWKESDGVYAPSLLDHAVATEGLVKSGSVGLHGYSEALRCAPHRSTLPEEFETVSDRCPVTF